ncbi:lipase [Phycicoccus sp. BSK3Z-2]|uniref:Lipase n=1 Tax=Phycicoccus avicenniae TaxID=2828860 RepID=A0A941D6L9_9MICO|nr:GDSL-type esterase/lipase family protein [Phycicoccus avicenniae]MBR7741750.1 lipase [Phycicoccus avicenniae]
MTSRTTNPVTPDLVHGAVDTDVDDTGRLTVHRLPAWARARGLDPQLATVEAMPAGVRLRFSTAATFVELDAHVTRRRFAGLEPAPAAAVEVLVDGRPHTAVVPTGGDLLTYDLAAGTVDRTAAATSPVVVGDLPAGPKTVEVRLPHGELVALGALRTDAPVAPVPPQHGRRWVHHGSSISQGSNAADPSDAWPVLAADLAGLDLTNLGFGGSAMLDPFVARTMRDLPADLLSVAAGINIVGGDTMRMRTFVPLLHGFLDTLRDGHPDTPLLVVTPILCPMHEDVPGPSSMDPGAFAAGRVRYTATGDPAEVARGRLTLRTVREATAEVVAVRADPHLHLVDGTSLYGEADTDQHPLPDGLHPDAATQRLVGRRFADVLSRGGLPGS